MDLSDSARVVMLIRDPNATLDEAHIWMNTS